MILPNLFLISESPRRKYLLESLGLPFEILKPNLEKELDAHPGNVIEVTKQNALSKAQGCLSQLKNDTDIAIGCDTLVVLENEVLGKPLKPNDVHKSLRKLSNRKHQVISGLALVSKKWGLHLAYGSSYIHFKNLSDEMILQYALTREPHDKAGSYAIQGLGALFIEKIEGSYTNVMGFPLEVFLENLQLYTHIPIYEWFK